MAVAPGHKKHVAGYLQHTVRYSSESRRKKHSWNMNIIFVVVIFCSFFYKIRPCGASGF